MDNRLDLKFLCYYLIVRKIITKRLAIGMLTVENQKALLKNSQQRLYVTSKEKT